MLTLDTSFEDIKKMPEFRSTADLLQGRCDGLPKDEDGETIRTMMRKFPSAHPESILQALNFLAQEITENEVHRFKGRENPACLVEFPGRPEKEFILLASGGGYHSVCSLIESFPAAARFCELGYTVYCLNYHTWKEGETLFPKPVEDLTDALRWILSYREKRGENCERYAAGGFSAGANLVSLIGLDSIREKYGSLPVPSAIFLMYPMVSFTGLTEDSRKSIVSTMFGDHADDELISRFDTLENMSDTYPPCYIASAENDDMVPFAQSRKMSEALAVRGIPCVFEAHPSGGHGFGDGRGTPFEGWMDRAADFADTIFRSPACFSVSHS